MKNLKTVCKHLELLASLNALERFPAVSGACVMTCELYPVQPLLLLKIKQKNFKEFWN